MEKKARKNRGFIHGFLGLPYTPIGYLRCFIHLCLLAAAMMVVAKITEEVLSTARVDSLKITQASALAAVSSINPLQIKDRFVCALTPSMEAMNAQTRAYRQQHPSTYLTEAPLSQDCAYTLTDPTLRAQYAAYRTGPVGQLPPPVVGHWIGGDANIMTIFIAFLDTAWHLMVQPSVLASIFALFSLVVGVLATLVLMSLVSFVWNPIGWPIVLALGTIACTCLVAFVLREVMELGLTMFGWFTQLAGACCASAGITYFGYTFSVKAFEVRIHEGLEHIIPD